MESTLTVSNMLGRARSRALLLSSSWAVAWMRTFSPSCENAAEGTQHDEQGSARGVVRDLAAANLIESGDLMQETRDFWATVLGKELHQRAARAPAVATVSCSSVRLIGASGVARWAKA